MTSLDVAFRQVLVYYGDQAVPWRHRLLLESGPVGTGRWVWATPDLEVQLGDLSSFGAGEVIPVRRAQPFPRVGGAAIYGFDPVTPEVLEQLQSEARSFAEVMGFTVAAAPTREGGWLVADPGSKLFGEAIPPEAAGDEASFVVRGRVALAQIDGVWLHCSSAAAGGAHLFRRALLACGGR